MSKEVEAEDKRLASLEQELYSTLKAKNTVPLSEFKHYQPLFQTSSIPEASENPSPDEVEATHAAKDRLYELSRDWRNRVSLQEEVQIVDDATGDVLVTLPAVQNRIPTMNETLPEHGGQLMDALDNSMVRSSSVRNLAAPYIDAVKQVIKKSILESEVKKKQARFNELAAVIEGDATIEPKESSKSVPTGTEWN